MSLRENQKTAIQISLENDFASGIHFHATGTGKSWIALQLLTEFNRRPGGPWNILWICEQKSVLLDQFQTETLAEKGFGHIQRDFLIFDYSRDKPVAWAANVNSASVWRKSILVIINRAFLVSKTEYTRLRIPFHLILHDECHSVTNTTTQAFYTHMLAKTPLPKCIGFSATPTITHEPFKHVLSKYTIYDACQDETIVPPKIAWLNTPITGNALRDLCATTLFNALPYKKILVWCGMIDLCYSVAAEWRADSRFAEMLIAVDTSRAGTSTAFANYEAFVAAPGNALLFCAGKHREGSDIPLLDGCIFLDAVAKRNHKTFIQCIGRVLRRESVKAIEEYEKIYLDPFGQNSYKTSGFSKRDGKIRSEPTMLSPKNIVALNPVDLPDCENPLYSLSELYDDCKALQTFMRAHIPIGNITTYRNSDNTIQYRGKTIPIHKYESVTTFKKMDIYGGISREIDKKNVVCRIMPVLTNDCIKWIAIYLKASFN